MIFHLLAAFLLTCGLLGLIFHRHHILRVLISIELMTLGVMMNTFASGSEQMVILILTISAAEAAVGLALFMRLFRGNHSATLSDLENLGER